MLSVKQGGIMWEDSKKQKYWKRYEKQKQIIIIIIKYLDLARELKKLWNMKVTIVTIVIGALGTTPKGLLNWRTSRDYPNDSIAKNGQNTETSPGDLRRLAVTQTPV